MIPPPPTEPAFPTIIAVVAITAAVVASGHVVLRKRDVRAAIGWVGVIWLVPLVGPALYLMFGINRVKRRALRLRVGAWSPDLRYPGLRESPESVATYTNAPHMAPLARLMDNLVDHPVVTGNTVTVYSDGDAAFLAMLDAIKAATRSVTLATYIFDVDRIGTLFIGALADATARGVEVRVLIDGVGARYSRPPAHARLRRRGVRTARFAPTIWPWALPYFNLRNHRKILVVDGVSGFTGGLNIREGAALSLQPPPAKPALDVHVRFIGPVVAQMQQAFAKDWQYVTGEALQGDSWFPDTPIDGAVVARAIPDGPDGDFEHLRNAFLGGLTCACHRVQIITPYFLPDTAMISALSLAAMRGVRVDVVVPAHNNQRLVAWAQDATIGPLLEHGVRIWAGPETFDHTKLMVVDGIWSLVGSGNWDPRSFRLNFELNVEAYSRSLAQEISAIISARIAAGYEITAASIEARRLPRQIRDGLARLLTPYL